MTDEAEDEKQRRINGIKTLHAFHLFCEHKFEESMHIFVTLGTGKCMKVIIENVVFDFIISESLWQEVAEVTEVLDVSELGCILQNTRSI